MQGQLNRGGVGVWVGVEKGGGLFVLSQSLLCCCIHTYHSKVVIKGEVCHKGIDVGEHSNNRNSCQATASCGGQQFHPILIQ